MHHHPTSGIAEAARAVRTNILFMSPDKPYRRLLVTSAGPTEGKTTVACCLAVTMAQAGQRVALVDCDMRRPRLHRIFGTGSDLGLTNALLEPALLDRSLQATEIANLSVLPLGPPPPNPAELLHSDSFARCLDALSEQFDRVVIDSPPIGPVTDATILSTQCDGTVVVVRSFETRKDTARRAMRSLRAVGARIVGAVLNAVDFDRHDYGYYSYYYGPKSPYAAQSDSSHSTESRPPSA